MVGYVGKSLEARLDTSQLDALNDNLAVGVVQENIAEPQGRRDVLDEQPKSRLGALANTFSEQILDGDARLDLGTALLLPPRSRTVFGVDIALAEDVVEDILQVRKLMVQTFELDELSGWLEVRTREEVIGEPEFSHSSFYVLPVVRDWTSKTNHPRLSRFMPIKCC